MYQFTKKEKLCSKKLIERLFTEGKGFLLYPIKVNFLLIDNNISSPAQVLITVSRKRFKKAVKRNRIKRLLRESYRLSKSKLYFFLSSINKNCLISIAYISENDPDFKTVKDAIENAIEKIINDKNV